ncbi:ketopantoate reductase family protein [Cloacibacillus porcorum]
MKIAVLGIGGVGGIVGGALAKNYTETYFYVRGKNLDAIRRRGLRVRSALLGDFTVQPKLASDSAEELGLMDVIFVSCKGYNLRAACESIAPMIKAETLVIPLLNGVIVSDMMRPMLPPCLLADGIIRVFSHLEQPGHIVQSYGPCSVILGMRDGGIPQKLEETAAIVGKAGIGTTLSDDILADSWNKYMMMCGNSVLFCCCDGPAGKVREHPDHMELVRAVAGELIAVAAASGVTMPADMADRYTENFSKLAPEAMSSLYRDLSGGKPPSETELDHIIGRMIELGRQYCVPTPYHKAAYERFTAK